MFFILHVDLFSWLGWLLYNMYLSKFVHTTIHINFALNLNQTAKCRWKMLTYQACDAQGEKILHILSHPPGYEQLTQQQTGRQGDTWNHFTEQFLSNKSQVFYCSATIMLYTEIKLQHSLLRWKHLDTSCHKTCGIDANRIIVHVTNRPRRLHFFIATVWFGKDWKSQVWIKNFKTSS